MNNAVSLSTLNDRQKIWLSQISYLNINSLGRQKIENGGLKVSELVNYLEKPEKPFAGNAMIGDKNYASIAEAIMDYKEFPSKIEMLNTIVENGLGDLTIVDISEEKKVMSTGFQALTFEDSYGNKGISYRGSDFDFSKGGAMDWLEGDLLEYFKNDSSQVKEAMEYFEKNKSQTGNNYLYGHSLGGNLTSHVYVEKYNEINEAFTINGNPINQKLIDTDEKVAAFNNPKYNCNVICGDIIGHLKSCESYQNNVKYIKNNNEMKKSFISAHIVQSATYDENGNFVNVSKEEMKKEMGSMEIAFVRFTQNVREALNKIGTKFEHMKESFKEYKDSVLKHFNKKSEELGYKKGEVSKEEFQTAARQAELEEIARIQELINNKQKEEVQDYEDGIKTR